MNKIIFVLTTIVFLFSIYPGYALTTITAEVDKFKITAQETVNYKITIESDEKNLPLPEIPDFEGFFLLSQSQTSQLSLTGKDIKNIAVYVFVLAAIESGILNIGPTLIKTNSGVLKTEEFEIEVILPLSEPSTPKKNEPEPTKPRISEEGSIII
ncbi:MAG: BatD family protein [Candidatus Omnitrophota bacterium]